MGGDSPIISGSTNSRSCQIWSNRALLLIHISNGNLISLIVAPLGSLGCYIVLSKLMNIEGFNLLMDKLSLRRN